MEATAKGMATVRATGTVAAMRNIPIVIETSAAGITLTIRTFHPASPSAIACRPVWNAS